MDRVGVDINRSMDEVILSDSFNVTDTLRILPGRYDIERTPRMQPIILLAMYVKYRSYDVPHQSKMI